MTAAAARFGTITTDIPQRLDRLPWTRFHWRIVLGLGTVWILDGLEVTIVGAIGPRLTEAGAHVGMTPADIGFAGAIYVTGAVLGSLFFGQLTDRHGRKRLMMLTLAVYVAATVATAFAFSPWYFFLCRFFTGAGIGGEYSAINSAIDELIPARNRGQVDITINGSYWVGSGIGGLAALLFLDQSLFAASFGWRLAFAIGGILGLGILFVRRAVPESPRWLLIHGQEGEADRIVTGIEQEARQEIGHDLPAPVGHLTVRQRPNIPFREIAEVAIRYYPQRAALGLALFVGQAFLYNAVTFNLGTMLNVFFGVPSSIVPLHLVIFAAGNFLGPLLLGRLFDTVGRRPMITGTYLISAALTLVLAALMIGGGLSEWSFSLLVAVTFFFASAGASSAYLTVSEIFPLETRALAIAFFYSLGTGLGGIIGPALFGSLVSGGQAAVAVGFVVGAIAMALGGIAEILFGVKAEGVSLENLAKPITVAEAEAETGAGGARAPGTPAAAVTGTAGVTPSVQGPSMTEAFTEASEEAGAREERIRERNARRRAREIHGLNRFRPGPGEDFYSPAYVPTFDAASADQEARDAEISAIESALRLRGRLGRGELARAVGAGLWGPGRFGRALREAVDEGRVRRLAGGVYAPTGAG